MPDGKENREYQLFDLEKLSLRKKIFLSNLKIFGYLLFLFITLFFVYKIAVANELISSSKKSENKIAVINFNKEITDGYVNKIMEDTDKELEDKNYKEILFIMNSPGGSPSASEEMSEYLKNINKKIKVTMYVESVAASGGYYIASAIYPLHANKNAIVGSIGVIMEHYNFEKLANKIGVSDDYIAKGEFKKPLSVLSSISPKTKDYLDSHLLSPMYKNFIEAVAINRKKSIQEIENVAGGTIYLANDSRVKGILVDKITSLNAIKNEIKKRNINSEFVNINEEKESLFGGLNTKVSVNFENLSDIKTSTALNLK